jgi:hypothetical protein
VVEGARLESVYTSKAYRGFESLPVRSWEPNPAPAAYHKGSALPFGYPREQVMLIRRLTDIPSSAITDESLPWDRRSFIKAAGPGV